MFLYDSLEYTRCNCGRLSTMEFVRYLCVMHIVLILLFTIFFFLRHNTTHLPHIKEKDKNKDGNSNEGVFMNEYLNVQAPSYV